MYHLSQLVQASMRLPSAARQIQSSDSLTSNWKRSLRRHSTARLGVHVAIDLERVAHNVNSQAAQLKS